MTTANPLQPTRLSDGLPLALTTLADDGDGTVVSDSMTDYDSTAGGRIHIDSGSDTSYTNGMHNGGGTLGRGGDRNHNFMNGDSHQDSDSTRPTGTLPYPNPNRLSQHLQFDMARNSVASMPGSSIHGGTPRNSLTPGMPPLQAGRTSTVISGVSRPSTAASSGANTFGRREPQPPMPQPPPRWGSPPAEEQKGRNGSVSMRGFPGRPESSASKSHVPSITSHAFLRPMSSAKLQAQRGRHMEDHDSDDHGGSQDGNTGYGGYPLHPPGSMNRSSRLRHGSLAMADVDENSAGLQLPQPTPIRTSFDGGVQRSTFNSVSSQDREQYTGRTISQSPTPNTMRSMHSGASDLPLHSPALGIPPTSQSNGHHSDSSRMDGNSTGHSNPHASTTDLAQSSSKRRRKKEKRQHIRTQDGEDEEFIGWNFEAFPGNTVFCFWGRCQTARDHPMNVLTAILVLLPTGLFFGYSGPWLWQNSSPALPITFGYLFLICFSSFIKAAVSDPGVYPRNTHLLPSDPPPGSPPNPLAVPPASRWAVIKPPLNTQHPLEVPVKYCTTCRLWRPPRAHHCRVCNNCVEFQDHHCVWLNNCVGRRNYRYFFTFVTSTMLLALYLLALSLAHLLLYANKEDVSFATSVNRNSVAFGMVVYGALASLYPAALCTYHIFLMARGETTREYLNSHKYPKDQRHRPYNQLNWVKNWIVVLCRPRGPSYVELKEHYRRGDTRFYRMDEQGVHKEEWGEEGGEGEGHGEGADREGENRAEGQRSLTSRVMAA